MRWQPRLAVVAALALLLVAGCGGDPKPKSLPSPSVSPSPSASASATPPAVPELARQNSRAGAVAFVKHYVSVLNFVTFNGNVEPARALDAGHCVSCNRMLGAIDAIYTKGGHVEGGAWTPTVVSDVRNPNQMGWTVDAKVTYGPQKVTRATNAKPERYTGGGRLLTFILTFSPEGWKVSDWTRAS
jgi:hypothetical protein